MEWRYQSVFRDHVYWVVQVYFDDAGRLESWTADWSGGIGDDLDDLCAHLERMLSDAREWKPVPYDSLRAGMTFERVT